MKNHLIIFILIAALSSCRPMTQPGMPIANDPCQQRVMEVEHQLDAQRKKTDTWAVLSGSLGVLSVLLFVIGAAIGAKTRHAPRTLL